MERFDKFVEFMTELARFVPDDARMMACQVPGDPGKADKRYWSAKPLTREQFRDDLNVYTCVSAMKMNDRGEFRRKEENFGGGLCLMIDDIGKGLGSKIEPKLLKKLTPTAIVETSPDNYQAIYMFDRLVSDPLYFKMIIDGFIERNLTKDTGMKGINRVFRPPFGINGKPKYGGFQVELNFSDYSIRYDPEKIIKAFGIPMKEARVYVNKAGSMSSVDQLRAKEMFAAVKKEMIRLRMRQRDTNIGGWTDVYCPWRNNHSDAVDTGAALREPNADNDWSGAFNCHHGSCLGQAAEKHGREAKHEGERKGLKHVIAWLIQTSPSFAAQVREMETRWDNEDAGELNKNYQEFDALLESSNGGRRQEEIITG